MLASAAVGGSPLLYLPGDYRFTQQAIREHIEPGLAALRQARELGPLQPEVHALLGRYASFFRVGEPRLVHLQRGLRLMPSDAELHRLAGQEAWKFNQPAAAYAHWRRSLELQPAQLVPLLRRWPREAPLEALYDNVLPDDPIVLLDAARWLFLRPAEHPDGRRLLEKAALRRGSGCTRAEECVAVAQSHAELGRASEAAAAWRDAIRLDPQRRELRAAAADYFEQAERYDDALEQLEWLLQRQPGHTALQERVAYARHGLALQREIDR